MKTKILLMLALLAAQAIALSCTTSANGVWQNSGIWSCGAVPDSDDNATIGHAVNFSAGVTVGNVTINNGGYLTGLSYDHSFASLIINSGGTYNATTGKTTITSASSAAIYPYQLYVAGDFIHNNGIVVLAGGDNTRLDTGTKHLYNLVRNGAGYCYADNANVYIDNDLNVTSGAVTIYHGDESYNIGRNVYIAGGASFPLYTSSTSSKVMIGKNLTVLGTLEVPAGGVNVSGATYVTGTVSFSNAGPFFANGTLTLDNGASFGSNKAYSLYNQANMLLYGGSTFNAPNASGTWKMNLLNPPWYFLLSTNYGVTFNHDYGTLRIEGPGGGENNINAVMGSLYNLVINASAASVYVSYGDLNITGNLTVAAGYLRLDYSSVPHNLTVNGTTSISGTVYPGDLANPRMTFNGPLTVNSGGTLGGNTGWNLSVNAPFSNFGTFRAPNNTGNWTQNGTFVNLGSFYNDSGTANFSANAYIIGVNSTWPFNNLLISKGANVTHMADGLVAKGLVSVMGRLDSHQNALYLDGAGDYATASSSASLNLSHSTGTVELWYYARNYTPTTTWSNILEKGADAGWDTPGYTIWYYGTVRGHISTTGYGTNYVDFGIPSLYTWHHVVFTWDGSYLTGYLDGAQVSKVAQTVSNIYSTEPLVIGKYYPGAYYFNGTVDEVRIYNRTLSATEAAEHYRNVYSNEASLAAKWRFSEGGGTTSADESGNGNTATLTGATRAVPNTAMGYTVIGSGGIFNATMGNTTLNAGSQTRITNSGTFDPSNGTVVVTGLYGFISPNGGITLFNLVIDGSTSTAYSNPTTVMGNLTMSAGDLESYGNTLNVFGNFTINGGQLWTYNGGTIRMGTAASQGTFLVNTGGALWTWPNSTLVLTANSSAYPAILNFMGTVDWDAGGGPGVTELKWVDIQSNLTTNSGAKINISGNVSLEWLTISAGDALNATVPGTTINASGNINIYGTGRLNATTGRITVTGYSGFVYYDGSTIDLKGVDFNPLRTDIEGLEIGRGGSVTSNGIENCSFNTSGNYGAAYYQWTTSVLTIRNSNFSGSQTGQDSIYRADISMQEGKLQLQNSSFARVVMIASSGSWVISRSHNRTLNSTVVWGSMSSETASSGFRAGDITGNLSIWPASGYLIPSFNTSYILGANMPNVINLNVSQNTTFNTSGYNLTVQGIVDAAGAFNASNGVVSIGDLKARTGSVVFSNVSDVVGSVSVGTLYRYINYQLRVVNATSSPVSGASVSLTDGQTGAYFSGTTNANGYWYPKIFKTRTDSTGTFSVLHNFTASNGGQWNSIWANSTRGNQTIMLGSSQGYAAVGNVSASGFTANVTVGGSQLLGPYRGMQPVELRNGTQIIAKFQHDFTAGDLDLNTITVRAASYWVGFSGEYPATLYTPLRGTYCNVHVCTGITNISETCSDGWQEWSSEPQGWYCLAVINGTVVEEQVDPGVTRLVAAPVRWEWVAALFLAAAIAFWRKNGQHNV